MAEIRRTSPAAAALLLVLVFSSTTAGAQQDVSRLAPYSGPKLTGRTFLCTSDQNVSGGYWYESAGKTIERGGRIESQRKVNSWRITLRTNDAQVIRFSGVSQTIEEPEYYSLEVTATGGLLLVWQNRLPGQSPQIISIDPENSSFVYSTQYVDTSFLRFNRVNVFYGSCRPVL